MELEANDPSARQAARLMVEEMLKKTGWSPSRLAKEANIAHTTVTRLLDNASRHAPNINTLLKLAQASGTNIARLTELGASNILGPKRVPVVSWVQAGAMAATTDPYPPGHAEEYISVTYESSNMISLKVLGSSINQIAQEGAHLIVDLDDKDLVDRKLYVFRQNDEATVKVYRPNPPRLVPASTDRNHETIFPEGDIEVVGRVVQVIHQL